MARQSKEQRLQAVHADALTEFDDIQSAVRDERMQCLEDRRFYSIAGAQWEGPLDEQFANRPKMEINKIHLSVMRIINEYRNNRITVDFIPKEGAENDKLADTCDGLYRSDEEFSSADEAYDNAFEEAVGGGIGAWRLRAVYEDDEDDDDDRQRVSIEPIYDADSTVFFDLGAKRQDKSDAKRCYVLTSMTLGEYEETWGDSPASWPKDITMTEFDWSAGDVVYVAELYKVEEVRHTVHIYTTLEGEEERYTDADFENDEMLEDTLMAIGTRKTGEKKTKKKKVHKYIMSGGAILEDCGYIAGQCIPIVMVYGKRWFVDNVERCMGHVRLAKDVQRLKNMQLSKLAEISALSTVEKPIMLPEQVAGYEMMWAEDNLRDYPYLLVNPITDATGAAMATGPIGYTKSPQIPPAMAALLQITDMDMQELLGRQESGEQLQPNVSGKAIELVQSRLDMQAFIYMSNMSKAIKRSGEVWLSMAKDILVESGRKMKTLNSEYEAGQVELGKPMLNPETGEIEYENDLRDAKFDLSVDVGPSSSSKRASTVRSLTAMMQMTQDPENMAILNAMAMMNMEGEGLGDVRKYYRTKLVKMGVIQPSEQEAADLAEAAQNAQPDANAEYLKAAALNETAKAEKTKADTLLSVAKASETEANTMETLSKIKTEDQGRMIKAAEQVRQMSSMMGAQMPQQPQQMPQREPDMASMSTEELIRIAQGGQ
jgi:hypothetical protein